MASLLLWSMLSTQKPLSCVAPKLCSHETHWVSQKKYKMPY